MPRRLNISPEIDHQTRSWVRASIRIGMAREELSYRELAERMCAAGWEENEKNLRNKVAQGELPAAGFLLCLKLMNADPLNVDGWSLTNDAPQDDITIDKAFESELIHVIERDDEAGIFRVRIGILQQPITIVLKRLNGRRAMGFTLSHVIRPIGQTPPTRVSYLLPQRITTGMALRRIVRLLVTEYQQAVSSGHPPEESWLVPYRDATWTKSVRL